jgi:two-component system, sensor histidine kinase and response regulator
MEDTTQQPAEPPAPPLAASGSSTRGVDGAAAVAATTRASVGGWRMVRRLLWRLFGGARTREGVVRIERKLEHLSDLRWQLHDDEGRYRELLDGQTDIIMRVDEAGRLSFVNRAFCDTFGVAAGSVLGKPWQFDIVQGDGPEPGTRIEPGVRQRYELEVGTAAGPRWFAFQQHGIGAARGVREQQIVGRDTTEQRIAVEVLNRSRDEAEAANRAKSRFLAIMSHEIRTPMNGILGMSGLLIDSELSGEQRTYARAIDQSAKNLLKIIDEILDLSKIEVGRIDIHPVPFALDVCVQSVVELMAPKATEKGLEIVWRAEPSLPRVLIGDETRVRQIVLNLVANAIKFTDVGGVSIRVGYSPTAPRQTADHVGVEIVVTDTGIGIAADELHALLDDPDIGRGIVARQRGGTGLGLAISSRLARAMGGAITAESRPGGGSAFTVRLTLGVVEGAAPVLVPRHGSRSPHVLLATPRPLERDMLGDCLRTLGVSVETATVDATGPHETVGSSPDIVLADAGLGSEDLRALLAACRRGAPHPVKAIVIIDPDQRGDLPRLRDIGFDAWLVRPVRTVSLASQLGAGPGTNPVQAETNPIAVDPARPPPKNRTVLLVEDNEINALLARRMGERADCEILHARSGREALALCGDVIAGGRRQIDLVLMDIQMPEMNGFETTLRLRDLFSAVGRKAPPIAALTANAYPEDRRRCREEGLDDFLAKPFDRQELESLLERWCAVTPTRRASGILANNSR